MIAHGGGAAAASAEPRPPIKSTEGKAYDVPDGTSWDAVKSFYSAALEKAGWVQAKVTDSNLGYARGNQAVNVMYVDGAGLVVVLSEGLM